MKPIVLHPGSVLIGAVFACIAICVVGAQTPTVDSVLHPKPRPVEVHVAGITDPQDIIVLREEDGVYTVPNAKRFVLTAVGISGCGGPANIAIARLVSGGSDPTAWFNFPVDRSSVQPVPNPTITFAGGEQINVWGGCGYLGGRAWGYLIDE